jgi:hypothetical protein
MSEITLIAECNAERALIKLLELSDKKFKKANGKNTVIKLLNGSELNKKTVVGIVDRDNIGIHTFHPNYLTDYEDYALKSFQLYLRKKKTQNHYLIEFEDEFEPWFIKVAKDSKVQPPSKNYFDRNWLHAQNRPKDINKSILKYYTDVIAANPAPFNQIKTWIEKIQNNTI